MAGRIEHDDPTVRINVDQLRPNLVEALGTVFPPSEQQDGVSSATISIPDESVRVTGPPWRGPQATPRARTTSEVAW
jgi:hypothetical protein